MRMAVLITSLLLLTSTSVAVGSRVASQAQAAGIYGNGCITYDTGLPFSVNGSQFIVRSYAADSSEAAQVAKLIDTKSVFKTYEEVLGITSLLQPGENTLPLVGGEHPFPIFIDPGLGDDASIFAPLCTHTSWGALVVSSHVKDVEHADATMYFALFQAAQYAFLQELGDPGPNWWFLATAAAATAWLDAKIPATYDTSLTNHPETAMDGESISGHELGAYRFVQWVIDSSGVPGSKGSQFLRDSIEKVKEMGPADGVSTAIQDDTGQTIADQVGSFWEDHTNPKPKFGPTGLLEMDPVDQPAQTITLNPATKLGAVLAALKPAKQAQQMQVVVDQLPADVELYLNNGDGTYLKMSPGASIDKLFCRTGYSPGARRLPKTGDVRIAVTTTGDNPPASVDVKVLTSTTACPKQFVVVPGLEAGPFYLGMTMKNAGKVVKPHSCGRVITAPGGINIQTCEYVLAPQATVLATFLNGKIGVLQAGGQAFATTTGIATQYLTGALVPNADGGCCAEPEIVAGSTEQDFVKTAANIHCEDIGSGRAPNHLCAYTDSQGLRYTFAVTQLETCTDDERTDGQCFWPGDGYYVGSIGVATQQGAEVYTCLEYQLNCP